ncbi:MAG: YggS family pyridoxal phosphate-dependent enzyme [candidate division KSB1 bacterium]|nr:YggS family pyridoxal phosphate-dependent enzyme [candidate division KSB1 bacterium]MDZ7272940.1 YggS family pyridoxal phosphate-dependent enzyme [candidate division KSB1 bacterium]MDZ7284038.1 YggS family pyridoxal phosphate-dependent enzyme [candidate division KSB1 bacterium]MDZ7297565.1 YggS family pyridoxal phosphate-dependent enzyme [candidate division KSB1 bacterium]MDZ7308959.1 YggS family pyridoxal phosphate-dependent enzyme [candidate division KSB1 bacterium]
MAFAQQLAAVQQRIADACQTAGRDPAEITLIGVTKTVAFEDILAASQSGLRHFGENRVQEAARKISAARAAGLQAQWHLVGHLQTNKAKEAVALFDVIQSVDSVRVAEALQRHAEKVPRRLEVLLQVNTSAEATKFGVAPAEAAKLAAEIAAFPNLHLTGLMTIGALTTDSGIIRRCFQTLRVLLQELAALHLPNTNLHHLSMGMTDDFELAIAEGATMVRIGRALFGERR